MSVIIANVLNEHGIKKNSRVQGSYCEISVKIEPQNTINLIRKTTLVVVASAVSTYTRILAACREVLLSDLKLSLLVG